MNSIRRNIVPTVISFVIHILSKSSLKYMTTVDLPLSVLNIMNLPIDYVDTMPTLNDADLSELYSIPTDSTIGKLSRRKRILLVINKFFAESSSMNLQPTTELEQNLQPPLSTIIHFDHFLLLNISIK